MHSSEPERQAPPDMFTPAQIRKLKIAVIGMGAVLLAGFALVIGRIIYLVNAVPRPDAPVAGKVSPATTLALPAGATVRHIAISGNRLAVHFDAPGGVGIRIIDLSGATPTVTIPVTAEPEAQRRP
jgi:hypothetical protein